MAKSKITLCKKDSDVPDSFAPNTILMNGSTKQIKLRQKETIVVEKIEYIDTFKTFKGIQQGRSLAELADFANHCDCVGAVLWYDSDSDTYTISNGDPNADDYWNPYGDSGDSPSSYQDYGTIMGICAGLKLWVDANWIGVEIEFVWAVNDTPLYYTNFRDLVQGTGWDNTNYIMSNYYNQGTPGSIWELLTNADYTGLKKWIIDENDEVTQVGDLYIPNAGELREIWRNVSDRVSGTSEDHYSMTFDNNNIGLLLKLSSSSFWSSSQFPNSRSSAFSVGFDTGDVYEDGKSAGYLSLTCIHFPEK